MRPAVLLGNPDPAVGDLVQVDQVVGLDLARLAQSGDHFLDQLRVILGELNRQGSNALSVRSAQHDAATSARFSVATHNGVIADGMGLNSTATRGERWAGNRARPEPPSNTPTGRRLLVNATVHTVLSFIE
jgi:hypothetical protein